MVLVPMCASPDPTHTARRRGSWRSAAAFAVALLDKQGSLRLGVSPVAQAMAVRRNQVQAIDASQLRDLVKRQKLKWRLVFQRVQHDALEKIAKRQVKVFRQTLEHLQ